VSRSALQLLSLAPVGMLLLLLGCSRGERAPTTPDPTPTPAAPQPSPPPRVAIALGPAGATVAVANDRCVTVAGQPICGEGALGPADLGGHELSEGWVIPAAVFAIADAEVTLEVGEGIEALGPHGDADAYLRPGTWTRRLRDLGWVELAERDEGPAPDTRLESYERAAVAVEAWLDEPRRRLLWAEEDTPGAVSIAPENPSAALVQAWLVAAPEWWNSGVADYLSLLIRHQAGALPRELAYDELLDRYTRHRDRPGESPLSAEGRAAADIGALVALCVDIELRTQSTSLPRALAQIDGGPIGPEALLDAIAADHPDIAARHRARATQRGVIELDGCLRRGGRKLIAHHVPIVDPARLLRVGALDPETAEVRERGRGPLRPGDVVQHVRGRAIRRAWDIVFYLRDLGGQHRFSVSVQRGEQVVRTWLRMVAVDDELPTEVRFTAVEDDEADNEGDPFRGPIDDRH